MATVDSEIAKARRAIEEALIGMLALEAEQLDLHGEIQAAQKQIERLRQAKQKRYQKLQEAVKALVRLTA